MGQTSEPITDHRKSGDKPLQQEGEVALPAIKAQSTDMREIARAAFRREQLHNHVSDGFLLQDGQTGVTLHHETHDHQLKTLMDRLAVLHAAIVASEDVPCQATVFKHQVGQGAIDAYRLTRLGKKVRACCLLYLRTTEALDDWMSEYGNNLFSPTITVMLRAMQRWSSDVGYWLDAGTAIPAGAPDVQAVDALRRLVGFVRRASATWRYKNARSEYERQAESNFQSARSFILHLFRQHSRLLVLRVDVYLRQQAKSWGHTEEADRAAACFARRLREERDLSNVLGWISKREHGIDRGIHWHWMVFLDGHQHRNACGLTRKLGEVWQDIVTVDRGSYFNCYARSQSYEFNGLGLVHFSDLEKLMGLRAAVWYMTKRDCVLRTDTNKHQDFRRSKPRSAMRSGRGAPRKDPDALTLVNRIFSGKRSKYPPSS